MGKNINTHMPPMLMLLALLVLILQYLRLNHLAPPPENIWDNVYLWDWARSVSQGQFENFVIDSHHQLRWGNWGFAAILISFFSDEILYYYLTTLVPSTLAILIFVFLAWRNFGTTAALIFVVLWFFDALLFRASFQLLPSGSALLPIALLLTLCDYLLHTGKMSLKWQIVTALTVFWLYGTKETHLSVLPALMWLMYRIGGLKPILFLLIALCFGYVIETLMFNLINPDFSWLGRLHSIIDGGQHIKLMTEQAHYVGQQTRYFDSGITMRWVITSGVTPIAIFIGFIFSLLVMANPQPKPCSTSMEKQNNRKSSYLFLQVLAVFIISFIVCNTFFIISVNPIRLGQPLVPRYATLLMPLVYMIIVGFLIQQTRMTNYLVRLGFIAILPFYVASSIERYSEYSDLSIYRISNDYNKMGKKLMNVDCVRAKHLSILRNQLDLVPNYFRTPKLQQLITNDDLLVHNSPWLTTKLYTDRPCTKTYTIHRIVTMRY